MPIPFERVDGTGVGLFGRPARGAFSIRLDVANMQDRSWLAWTTRKRQNHQMPDYADVDGHLLKQLGEICLALPEAWTEPAWTGYRFLIRKRNFVHIFAVHDDDGSVVTMINFRSPPEECEVLIASGHPFYRPGWGSNIVDMMLTSDTDWEEVTELMTESYCILAPKKLVAFVNRPDFTE